MMNNGCTQDRFSNSAHAIGVSVPWRQHMSSGMMASRKGQTSLVTQNGIFLRIDAAKDGMKDTYFVSEVSDFHGAIIKAAIFNTVAGINISLSPIPYLQAVK
jgi:hypothetical protein